MHDEQIAQLSQLYELGFAPLPNKLAFVHAVIRVPRFVRNLFTRLGVIKDASPDLRADATPRAGTAERTERQVQILAALRESGDPDVAAWLLPGVFSANERVAGATVETIADLMRGIETRDLANLENRLGPRYSTVGVSWQPYRSTDPGSLRPPTSSDETEVIGLASFHPNGRVREAACRLLGKGGIRYLLIRVNDWVPQVREAARRTLTHLLSRYPEEWVEALPALYRLRRCGRSSHSELIARMETSLLDPAAQTAVLRGLESEDQAVRRNCFRLALGGHVPTRPLLLRALENADVMVRRWGLEVAPTNLQGEELKAFLNTALANNAPSVRQQALRLWFEIVGESKPDTLLDPNRSVRDLAQFYHRDLDRESLYLEHLQILPQAVLGLAEIGYKNQDPVMTLLTSDNLKFQEMALKALALMKADERHFLEALASEIPRLSRVGARCLSGMPVAKLEVERVYVASQTEHVTLNAFGLLFKLSGSWERLELAIAGLFHPAAAIRDMAVERLRSLLGGHLPAYAPDPATLERLRGFEQRLTSQLTEDERSRLRKWLR